MKIIVHFVIFYTVLFLRQSMNKIVRCVIITFHTIFLNYLKKIGNMRWVKGSLNISLSCDDINDYHVKLQIVKNGSISQYIVFLQLCVSNYIIPWS